VSIREPALPGLARTVGHINPRVLGIRRKTVVGGLGLLEPDQGSASNGKLKPSTDLLPRKRTTVNVSLLSREEVLIAPQ
jgi:hypothetical protein